jgi:hypothetical protein
METANSICQGCGQLEGIEEYDNSLWDVYHRISDGRSQYEALVFDSEWLQENVFDEEDEESVNLAMERDMYNRGLCHTCGRPNLSGVTEDMIIPENEYQGMCDMWAEQAAERRAGC